MKKKHLARSRPTVTGKYWVWLSILHPDLVDRILWILYLSIYYICLFPVLKTCSTQSPNFRHLDFQWPLDGTPCSRVACWKNAIACTRIVVGCCIQKQDLHPNVSILHVSLLHIPILQSLATQFYSYIVSWLFSVFAGKIKRDGFYN